MSRNVSFTLLIVLIIVVGTGCSLLGFNNEPDKKGQLEATIDALAIAGESQDEFALEQYLASTIVARVLNGDGYEGESAQGKSEVIAQLQDMWDNMTTNNINIQLAGMSIRGLRAVVDGSFTLDFEDHEGTHARCVGTGTANFSYSGGAWTLSEVTVVDSHCDITPPDESGKDPDPKPNPDPVPPGVPHYDFGECRYMTLGMQDDQVEAVQETLNFLGYSAGNVDGHFGTMTDRAVRQFQKDAGLYVDGEIGPKTIEALHEHLQSHGGYYACDTTEQQPYAGETFVTYDALRPGTAFETAVIQYDSPVPGPTLVFVGCIHGNEQSGHLALAEAVERGITISRGRVIVVPEFNRLACENNRRTLSRSGSLLSGKDFNRMFPVGSTPTYLIAQELWSILQSQPDLAFVIDFHDGFVNSLANSLLHTRQSKAGQVAKKIRDNLNEVRPTSSTGPKWRAFTEPISGSLVRKVGRDMGVPGILVELAGRSPGDPVRLRKEYAWRLMRLLGDEYGIAIGIATS